MLSKKIYNLRAGNLPPEDPEQYEIDKMSREQKNGLMIASETTN